MANKIIDELIIKVKQTGAKPTEKAIRSLGDGLEAASAAASAFNEDLDTTVDYLELLEKSATRTATSLSKVRLNFSSASAENSLSSIENSLQTLVEESLETNDLITRLNNNLVKSFDNLANSLGVDLERVQDSIIDVGSAAGKTNDKLDAFDTKVRRVGRGLANQNRQGRNSARTFGDLAKVAGPLPLIYANIAANVFAISEAFRILTEGEQLNRLETVGTILGSQIGTPVQFIATEMQNLTGNTLSYAEALRNASAAASYGFDSTQIEQLTLAARRASVALGVDMQDAMNRVIRGTSKLEIELLDELGITTKLTTAYTKYAQQLGISADSLNSYQQRAALVAEINEQSVEKFGVLDNLLSNGAPWEKFGANAASAWQKFSAEISKMSDFIPEFFNKADEIAMRIEAPRKAAEQLAESMSKADKRGGMIGVMVVAIDKAKELEDNLKRLQAIDLSRGVSQATIVQTIDEINNTKYAIEQLRGIITSKELGVPDLEKADQAYKNLTAAVKGSRSSFDQGLASAKGTQTTYQKLYADVKNMADAYYLLDKVDPGRNSKDRLEALQALGFENESQLRTILATTRAYRDAQAAAASLGLEQAKTRATGLQAGLLDSRITRLNLEEELKIRQDISSALRGISATQEKIAQADADVLDTQNKIRLNDIAILDENYSRLSVAKDIQGALQPELLNKKAQLEVERERLSMLKNIEGSHQRQLEVSTKIKQIQADIASAELQQSLNLMNSGFSDLTSYGTGLDKLTGSLNSLSLSFNQVGQSSMTAAQMTATGLQAFQGMLAYNSAQSVSAIDAQIAAEQKRDGSSEQSLQKIKALEAKKIKEQKKAAQQQILISTAVAVMMAAANPWPLPAIPLMGAAALAGGLAYAQASSAASNQLSSLNAESSAASLTVGTRDNKVDVSGAASKGELSYVRGESGIGNSSSYIPRAAGGVGTPGTGIVLGETGAEVITPLEPVKITSAEDAKSSSGSGSAPLVGVMRIEAFDAQSVIDRASEIYDALEYEASQRGKTLTG